MQNVTKIKEILRSINLIYWAIFLGMVMFIVISAIYVSNMGPLVESDMNMHWKISSIMMISLIIIGPFSWIIPNKLIRRIDPNLELTGKLVAWRTAMLIRLSIMETAGVIVCLGFMATGNTDLILILAMVMLFFMIYKPNTYRIAADLGLTPEEKQLLEI
jgi:hypothetical protein